MPERSELTASEVQLIGDLLIPRVEQKLQTEFRAIRSEMDIDHQMVLSRMALLEVRVSNLEAFKARMLLLYGAVVAAVTLAYHLLKDYVVSAFKK